MRRRPRANRRFREATRRLSPSNFTVSRVVGLSSYPHRDRCARSVTAPTLTIEFHSVSSGLVVELSTPESTHAFDRRADVHHRNSQRIEWFAGGAIHTRIGAVVRSLCRRSPSSFTVFRVVWSSIYPHPVRPACSIAAPMLTNEFHRISSGRWVDRSTPGSACSFARCADTHR
jgi:hypothetical protein